MATTKKSPTKKEIKDYAFFIRERKRETGRTSEQCWALVKEFAQAVDSDGTPSVWMRTHYRCLFDIIPSDFFFHF